jgi:hypothetical protein
MQKPNPIDPLADLVLERLRRRPESAEVVLGGYFALQHYVNYRKTHDIDAWWKNRANPVAEAAIREVMQAVAVDEGLRYAERKFGETVSFELLEPEGKKLSFQIATRSIEIGPPQQSPWSPILLESLRDNIGSKMNALVNRGAPRDFTDIQMAVRSGLVTPQDCWGLWQEKNPGEPIDPARQKVLLHLSGLEQRRPLDTIPDPAIREQAQHTREWIRGHIIGPDFGQNRPRDLEREMG